MPNTQIRSFFLNGWKSGWLPDLHDSVIPPDAVTAVENMDWNEAFGLEKRKGYDLITNSVAGLGYPTHVYAPRVFTTSGLHPNLTQQVHYFNESDGDLFTQSMGNLLEEDQFATGADLVASTHSLGVYNPAGNKNFFRTYHIPVLVYGSNIYSTCLRFGGDIAGVFTGATEDGTSTGATRPIKYDVQAGTFSRPVVHPLDGSTSGFPRARCALVKYERVFAANVHSQGVYRYPSRVYWSDAGTSETFDSTSFIDVGADDGSEITAMLGFGEQILIFKNTSVWALTGTDEDTFALFQLDDNLGTEASNGVVTDAGFIYFFDYRSGIWQYNGADFVLLSEPITETLLGEINRNAAFKCVMRIHQRKLYFSMPDSSHGTDETDVPTRTYVYDLDLQVWTVYDYGWTGGFEYFTDYNHTGVGVSSTGALYISGVTTSGGTNKGGIFEANVGYNDDTAAYTGTFDTSFWNPGEMGNKHRLRRADILVEPVADQIQMLVFRDFGGSSWQTKAVTPGVTVGEFHWKNAELDQGMFDWIKFRFRNATVDEQFAINGVGLSYSDRPRPRAATYVDGVPS